MGALLGIGVIGIDDDLLRGLVKRRYVLIEEQLPYAVEGLAADVVLQTGHRGLGRKIGVRGLTPAGHLQCTVAAKSVTVVGILIAAEYLAYTLADHFHVSVVDELLLPLIGDNAAYLPCQGVTHIANKQ